jgi:hypothetical protein
MAVWKTYLWKIVLYYFNLHSAFVAKNSSSCFMQELKQQKYKIRKHYSSNIQSKLAL